MKTTFALFGAIAVAGAGLVVAAANPQQTPRPERATTVQPRADQSQETASRPEATQIREAVAGFAKAFSAGDATALAELFIDDASIVNPEGTETRGKAAIAQMYATAFQETPGLKLETNVDEVRPLTPDVARVEGQSRLSSPKGDANEFTRFSALLIRQGGKWRAAELREYASPSEAITPYERLKELEWMVGDWVDESEHNKVQASIRWADNHSYLVRTYTVEIQGEKASSGTMFIGWDPQSGQIKSWVFSSEGGHGEGLWTRTADNQWVVKAQGVLHDGRPSSATQIHTILNKDAVKTSSIDRIIGGQVAPDIVDIVMVRKPPQPSLSAPKPATEAKTSR